MGGLKVLLYGKSGTGKTTLAATFPKPILWLICSGSERPGELRSVSAEDRKHITPRVVESSEQFLAETEGAEEFATVVLDHASGYSDLVLGEIIGRRVPEQKAWGLASQQQYGQLAALCKDSFRRLLNLRNNVVIVAQERVFGGGSDTDAGANELIQPTVGAALTPSLTGWLNPSVDYILNTFLRPKEVVREIVVNGKTITKRDRVRGKVEYCLRTGPDALFMTKFRKPRGSELPECVVDADYDDIVALSVGEPLPDRERE